MLILFGGGDGGGIYVDANGRIHRIPPWTPDVLAQLKAVNEVLRASRYAAAKPMAGEMHAFAEKLTTMLVPHIVRQSGVDMGGGGSVVFLDEGDGFTCGSTGQRPFPFPMPHHQQEFAG